MAHAEQLLFSCVSSKVSICNYITCHISPFTCHMLYVKCLCWSLGHAEQLLFSCLCSKVSICNYVTCHISHVTCHIAHVTCHMSNAYVDPWDMLNNFCFHVCAQKSLFNAENCNAFFTSAADDQHQHPVSLEFLELVPS